MSEDHTENDGCGDPAHNESQTDPVKEEWWDTPDFQYTRSNILETHIFPDIPKIVAEAERRESDRIKSFLLKNGHGGGNWRRLIEQI